MCSLRFFSAEHLEVHIELRHPEYLQMKRDTLDLVSEVFTREPPCS
jgi:hypothetical protein